MPQDVSNYLSSLYGLHGKTALISGGTRGIGRQIAIAVASAGADLILLVRNPSDKTVTSLVTTIESLGRKISIHKADLLDRTSYLPLISSIITDTTPTIFIHSAGLQHRQPAIDFPDTEWDNIIEVNLTAGFLISKLLAKHWINTLTSTANTTNTTSYAPGQHPHILLIASVLSRGPGSVHIPAYASSKGGVGQLTKALSNEWTGHGINVNSLAPGYFATELTSGITGEAEQKMLERVPAGRWGGDREQGDELGDLEGAAVWLCGRGSEFVSGECVAVDGGYSGR